MRDRTKGERTTADSKMGGQFTCVSIPVRLGSRASRSTAFATVSASASAPIGLQHRSKYPHGIDQVSVHARIIGYVLIRRSPLYFVVRSQLRVLGLGIFVIDEDEPSTEEERRVDWIGATLSLILIGFDTPTLVQYGKAGRIYVSHPSSCDSMVPMCFAIPRYRSPFSSSASSSYCLLCGNTTWNGGSESNLPRTR